MYTVGRDGDVAVVGFVVVVVGGVDHDDDDDDDVSMPNISFLLQDHDNVNCP
jgi:hypothetical protein